jgi:Transposase IS66 family
LRQTRAGPIVRQFGEWLDVEERQALPKSPFGLAVSYARNQWSTLGRYLGDARFTIGRVERWRGCLGQAHLLPALSSAGASLA